MRKRKITLKEKRVIDRIKNQLRIHWRWMRQEKDYKEVADMMCAWVIKSMREEDGNLVR